MTGGDDTTLLFAGARDTDRCEQALVWRRPNRLYFVAGRRGPKLIRVCLRPGKCVFAHAVGASAVAFNPAMIDWSTCATVERDPERVSGTWLFRGTRVPVAALFENLEDGVPVGEFVKLFPGVTLEQARAVLEHAARSALAA